jgi:hypothetical protein
MKRLVCRNRSSKDWGKSYQRVGVSPYGWEVRSLPLKMVTGNSYNFALIHRLVIWAIGLPYSSAVWRSPGRGVSGGAILKTGGHRTGEGAEPI